MSAENDGEWDAAMRATQRVIEQRDALRGALECPDCFVPVHMDPRLRRPCPKHTALFEAAGEIARLQALADGFNAMREAAELRVTRLRDGLDGAWALLRSWHNTQHRDALEQCGHMRCREAADLIAALADEGR